LKPNENFKYILQALLQEANQNKVVMEELNDRCEVLMELSACGWVRDHTVALQGAYTNALTTAQVNHCIKFTLDIYLNTHLSL
jgi:nesprin-1